MGAKEDKPRVLDWKGSHAAIAIHPDGTHVVTAMQEMALHGWRLADGQHMRMSGYPSKTHSLSFTSKGKWLATSGADIRGALAVLRRRPDGQGAHRARRRRWGDVHPRRLPSAARDGGRRLRGRAGPASDINNGRILPVAPPGEGGISALAWGANGTLLAFGTEKGFCGLIDLSAR